MGQRSSYPKLVMLRGVQRGEVLRKNFCNGRLYKLELLQIKGFTTAVSWIAIASYHSNSNTVSF